MIIRGKSISALTLTNWKEIDLCPCIQLCTTSPIWTMVCSALHPTWYLLTLIPRKVDFPSSRKCRKSAPHFRIVEEGFLRVLDSADKFPSAVLDHKENNVCHSSQMSQVNYWYVMLQPTWERQRWECTRGGPCWTSSWMDTPSSAGSASVAQHTAPTPGPLHQVQKIKQPTYQINVLRKLWRQQSWARYNCLAPWQRQHDNATK